MVVEVGGERLVAPPDYLIWVPADLPHTAFNEQTLDYTSIYVSHALAPTSATASASRTPAAGLTPCCGPCWDFTQRRVGHMEDEWDARQGELFIEKLARTCCQPSYLPPRAGIACWPLAGGIAGGAGGQPHAGGVGQALHHGAHPGAALPEGAWHEPGPVAHPAAAGEGAGLAAGRDAGAGDRLAPRLRLHLGFHRHVPARTGLRPQRYRQQLGQPVA